MSTKVILLVGAIICFALKGFNVAVERIDFTNLGFALVVASVVVG